MEVDDFELLELVNDYQERSDEPTFNTLDDIPEALMIEALDEANYIEDEINELYDFVKENRVIGCIYDW